MGRFCWKATDSRAGPESIMGLEITIAKKKDAAE